MHGNGWCWHVMFSVRCLVLSENSTTNSSEKLSSATTSLAENNWAKILNLSDATILTNKKNKTLKWSFILTSVILYNLYNIICPCFTNLYSSFSVLYVSLSKTYKINPIIFTCNACACKIFKNWQIARLTTCSARTSGKLECSDCTRMTKHCRKPEKIKFRLFQFSTSVNIL